jgi:hypothetical protein
MSNRNSPNTKIQTLIQRAFNVECHDYDYDRLDVQKGKLWDTYEHKALAPISNALHASRLFTNVGACSNKTFTQTNMQMSKRLAAPQVFAIESINFMFIDTPLETELKVADHLLWTLHLGCKWYARSTMAMMQIGSQVELDVIRECSYCSTVHVQVNCPNCGSGKFNVFSSSSEQPLTSHHAKRTVYIHPMLGHLNISHQMDFEVELSCSLELEPFTLKCWFDGLHARDVR